MSKKIFHHCTFFRCFFMVRAIYANGKMLSIPHLSRLIKFIYTVFNYFLRGNNISDIKEVQKLKCLPLLRALVLMGKNTTKDSSSFEKTTLRSTSYAGATLHFFYFSALFTQVHIKQIHTVSCIYI